MRYLMILLLVVPCSLAVSNVQHVVDGTALSLSYEGEPPFVIEIRGDDGFDEPGGFVWARTLQSSFDINLEFAGEGLYYYSVSDADGATTGQFVLGGECSVGGVDVPRSSVVGDGALKSAAVQQFDRYVIAEMRTVGEVGYWILNGESLTVVEVEGMLRAEIGGVVFPAVRFGDLTAVVLPRDFVGESVAWHAGMGDYTTETATLVYSEESWPDITLASDAPRLLSSTTYFNQGPNGVISFTVEVEGVVEDAVFATSNNKLQNLGGGNFLGVSPGFGLVYGRVGCLTIPQPAIVANGNYLLE